MAPKDEKVCIGCLKSLPRTSFRLVRPWQDWSDTRLTRCQDCLKIYRKAWAKNRPLKPRPKKDPLPDGFEEAFRDRDGSNRRPARLARVSITPDDKRISTLYALAAKLREAGRDVHVDHIVPIIPRSGQAQGLHVHANLQIIPAMENMRKGNRP